MVPGLCTHGSIIDWLWDAPGRAHDLGHGSSLGQGQFQTDSELREPVCSTPGSQGNESLDSEGGSDGSPHCPLCFQKLNGENLISLAQHTRPIINDLAQGHPQLTTHYLLSLEVCPTLCPGPTHLLKNSY